MLWVPLANWFCGTVNREANLQRTINFFRLSTGGVVGGRTRRLVRSVVERSWNLDRYVTNPASGQGRN